MSSHGTILRVRIIVPWSHEKGQLTFSKICFKMLSTNSIGGKNKNESFYSCKKSLTSYSKWQSIYEYIMLRGTI